MSTSKSFAFAKSEVRDKHFRDENLSNMTKMLLSNRPLILVNLPQDQQINSR